jgi:hypothetical protein
VSASIETWAERRRRNSNHKLILVQENKNVVPDTLPSHVDFYAAPSQDLRPSSKAWSWARSPTHSCHAVECVFEEQKCRERQKIRPNTTRCPLDLVLVTVIPSGSMLVSYRLSSPSGVIHRRRDRRYFPHNSRVRLFLPLCQRHQPTTSAYPLTASPSACPVLFLPSICGVPCWTCCECCGKDPLRSPFRTSSWCRAPLCVAASPP